MTSDRLAEIREALHYCRRAFTPEEIAHKPILGFAEELVTALETERERLDWLIRYLDTPEDEQPPFFVIMIGVPLELRPEQWRLTIDSAREGEKGELR
jgi:hypothetical protein